MQFISLSPYHFTIEIQLENHHDPRRAPCPSHVHRRDPAAQSQAGEEKKAIRSPRGRTDRSTLGDFYLLDTTSNLIVDMKLTPKGIEEMARERGVLAEWEKVK